MAPSNPNATADSQVPIYVVMIVDGWFPAHPGKPGVWGGRQVHVSQLRRYLKKDYAAKVELFYPKNPHPAYQFFWFFYVILDILLFARYKKIQILHAHGETSALVAKIVSIIRKIPVVVTVHNTKHLDRGHKTLGFYWQRWCFTQIKYDVIISVSAHFTRYKNVNSAIQIIPNGVDLNAFSRCKIAKTTTPSLIWVGNTDKSKGLDILKKAIVKVRKVFPTLQTELITNGRLHGQGLIRAYHCSHLFVLPSLTDSQPISLLEAWAAKLPVVVTNVGDNARIVKNEYNGLLVEPNNVRQLSQAIIRILRSRTLAPKLGQAGYQTVKQAFTWKQISRQIVDLYTQLISSHQPSAIVSPLPSYTPTDNR